MALTPAGADGAMGVSRFGIAVEDLTPIASSPCWRTTAWPARPARTRCGGRALKCSITTRDKHPRFSSPIRAASSSSSRIQATVSGGGPLGSHVGRCSISAKGLIAVRDYSHFTVAATSAEESNKFYQSLFGFGIRRIKVRPRRSWASARCPFLMFTGGGAARGRDGAPPRPPRVDHPCFGWRTSTRTRS